jgi:hypothetical protein
MSFIDPLPVLEERYQRELSELKEKFGEPLGFWKRMKFERERQAIEMRIFGPLRHTTSW